ncbi:hypothetical protein M011DRAFT_477660 [Sporormia fimetaria CBS 119925]|uniref:Uncharacterized protein n=1 Tax=Sporormia fimetaria CBS 119925 TaxID=1340428 RepID=A0A6A6VA96_9PLEO|nr:hypothetical protein M011DRAFT_477660 [Sporormia fimetaria CBS 119925]
MPSAASDLDSSAPREELVSTTNPAVRHTVSSGPAVTRAMRRKHLRTNSQGGESNTLTKRSRRAERLVNDVLDKIDAQRPREQSVISQPQPPLHQASAKVQGIELQLQEQSRKNQELELRLQVEFLKNQGLAKHYRASADGAATKDKELQEKPRTIDALVKLNREINREAASMEGQLRRDLEAKDAVIGRCRQETFNRVIQYVQKGQEDAHNKADKTSKIGQAAVDVLGNATVADASTHPITGAMTAIQERSPSQIFLQLSLLWDTMILESGTSNMRYLTHLDPGSTIMWVTIDTENNPCFKTTRSKRITMTRQRSEKNDSKGCARTAPEDQAQMSDVVSKGPSVFHSTVS